MSAPHGGTPRLRLTRRYRFPAAHVLRSAELSDAENERIYGKCANPNGHGHNYGLEVTVGGPIDPESGEILSRDRLDALVHARVVDRLAHRMLNDVAWFETRVPTAENIALFAKEALRDALAPTGAHLVRVRLHETRRNTFSCGAD